MSGISTVTAVTGLVLNFSNDDPADYGLNSSIPASNLWLAQWQASPYLLYSDTVTGSSIAPDPLYGSPAYLWSAAASAEQLALYNNPASQGGGYVYSLTNENNFTTAGGREVDMFLTTPSNATPVSFNNVVNLSFNAKITQDSFEMSSVAGATAVHDPQFEVGILIQYNGAGGVTIPGGGGFLQILWSADTNANVNYIATLDNTKESASDVQEFVTSVQLPGGAKAAPINADANASLDTYTYNLNTYVEYILSQLFSSSNGFTAAQLSALHDMANWSMSNIYIGESTNNQGNGTSTVSAQLSDVVVTANSQTSFQYGESIAAVPVVDNNPQLAYNDISDTVSGSVDGAALWAGLSAYDRYLYNGYDSISLSVPGGANWDFGGGYGATSLYAASGNNSFEGSSGTSSVKASTFVNVAGGTGTVNIYANSSVTITGATSSQITANEYGNSTIYAAGTATVALHAADSVSAHFTFINDSSAAAYLSSGATGSVTVSGGAGGGYFVGGAAGNNVLMGGTGIVTLVGGGGGDTLSAAGEASGAENILIAGNGNETLTASTATGANLFAVSANAGNDVISTAGTGDQNYFLGGTVKGSVDTITASAAATSNIFWLDADATAHASYVLKNLYPGTPWDLFLVNGSYNGPGSATVSGVAYGSGYAAVSLSNGAVVTLVGATSSNLLEATISTGIGPITCFY